MESMECRVDSDGFHGMADGFHGFSRWIPYDFMEFPDGFHTVFRVESIWNPYGMSSWNNNSTLKGVCCLKQ
jgi:hypothetical protein